MRVMVKKNLKDEEIVVDKAVNSLKVIPWEDVTELIYHSCIEEESEQGILKEQKNILEVVSILSKNISTQKVIYINAEPKVVISSLIQQKGGQYYEDETYLNNVGMLDYIFKRYTGLSLKVTDVPTEVTKIKQVLDVIGQGTEEEVIENILGNDVLITDIQERLDYILESYSETTETNVVLMDTLRALNTDIKEIQVYMNTQQETITNLQKKVNAVSSLGLSQKSLGGMNFPPCTVSLLNKKVLYIKCLGNVPYLSTFCYYYCRYINNKLKKKAKLLIVNNDHYLYDVIYKEIPKITSQTNAERESQKSQQELNTYLLTKPIQDLWDIFFKIDMDVAIVVDMMQSEKFLLNTHNNLKVLYALGSVGKYNQLISQGAWVFGKDKVALNRCIFTSTRVDGAFMNIPKIDGFAETEVLKREIMYFRAMNGKGSDQLYTKLDNFLGI